MPPKCFLRIWGTLNGAEFPGKFRTVLQGVKLGLLIGVTITHMRPAVWFCNPYTLDQQEGVQQRLISYLALDLR